MAYVVARRGGRFEIRESLHTAKGPRSRTLAGFDVLTEEVLVKAARRARRPFDVQLVIGSARRAGVRVRIAAPGMTTTASARFLAASKGMADVLGRPSPVGERTDAGTALLELLGFADMVTANLPPRPFEPLVFPVLAHVTEQRVAVAATVHRP